MKTKSILFFLTLLLTGVGWSHDLSWVVLNQKIAQTFPESEFITVEALRKAIVKSAPLVIIDVRAKAEFDVSHLKGAVHLETSKEILARYRDFKGMIVVYCSVGYRSGDIASQLVRSGMKRVKNLRGSIFEWAGRGYPLYNAKGRTTYVHPYDNYWGQLLPKKYHPPK